MNTQLANIDETVEVEQFGNQITFPRQHFIEATEQLTVSRRVPVDDKDFGLRVVKIQESLLAPPSNAEEAHGFANVGIYPVVKLLARDRGINVTKVRQENSLVELPTPLGRPSSLPGLLEFVQGNEVGIIQTKKPEIVIAELLAAFPGVYVAVVGSKEKRLKQCMEKLKRQVGEKEHHKIQLAKARHSVIFDGDNPLNGVVFSTFGESGGIDLEKAHIFIFLDAAECVHERAKLPLSVANASSRLFGFEKPFRRDVPPYEKAIKMRIFGPEVISFHGLATRRNVAVRWLPFVHSGSKRFNEHSKHLMHKHLWQNSERNQKIADTAISAAELLPDQGRTCSNVAVLVENIKQAVVLADLLPEWRIWANDAKGIRHAPKRFRSRLIRESHHWCTRRLHIVLAEAAATYQGAYDLDCVIFAGGLTTTRALPNSWLFSRRVDWSGDQQLSDPSRPLAIIDFDDRNNQTLSDWGRQRRRDYRRREIFDCGTSRAEGRIRQFLAELRKAKT